MPKKKKPKKGYGPWNIKMMDKPGCDSVRCYRLADFIGEKKGYGHGK